MPATKQPGSAWSTATSNAEAKWQQEARKATIKVDCAESSCQESSVTIVARTSKELLQYASKEGDVLISRPKVDVEEESLATADLLGNYARFNVSANAGLRFYTY
jgi:hypothetical protein